MAALQSAHDLAGVIIESAVRWIERQLRCLACGVCRLASPVSDQIDLLSILTLAL
jgi:hypothetical protein